MRRAILRAAALLAVAALLPATAAAQPSGGAAAALAAPDTLATAAPDTSLPPASLGQPADTTGVAPAPMPAAGGDGGAGRPARLVPMPAPVRDFVVGPGDTIWLLPPIEVLGRRATLALPGTVRSVHVLGGDELARLPGRSTVEALAAVPGVVLGQRQQYGVQSDLSLRGSTFEQVSVLLEGIELGDPQTGHHLLDLPLGPHDVSSLEVLGGHASVLHAGGALGGVVNVQAAWPEPRTGGRLAVTGGQDGMWGVRGSVDLAGGGADGPPGAAAPPALGGLRARLSGSRFRTDGDRPGTDADLTTATLRLAQGSRAAGAGDLLLGWARREFGAQDFYGPTLAYERTEAAFAAARWRADLGERLAIEPRLHVRWHDDRFTLDRADPLRYRNDHLTRRGGAELRSLLVLAEGWSLAGGLEGTYEEIESTGLRGGASVSALGRHDRRRLSGALELQRSGRLRWQVGARLDGRDTFSPRWSGTAAALWQATGAFALRAAAGHVHRVPTFTELYYADPYNLGSTALAPERSWNWEGGFDVSEGAWTATWTFFERHERDAIDWVRAADLPIASEPWRARNLPDGLTRGSEAALRWQAPRGHTAGLHLLRVDRDLDLAPGLVGKYALVAPTLHAGADLSLVLGRGLFSSWAARYTERTGGGPDHAEAFVLDWRLGWRESGWGVVAEMTNVLDRRYEEIPGVEMPGAVVSLTVERGI